MSKVTAIDPSDQTGQTVGFDQYNNQTDVWEYGYGTTPGGAGALIRRTHTGYMTSAAYTGSSVHLRRLVNQRWVSTDAGGLNKKTLTNYEYDNYTSDALHAPLTERPNISSLDGAFTTNYTTRGNITLTTMYAEAASGAGPVSEATQYDVAGNAVKLIDGRGYQTSLDFADLFGGPDGEARGNSAPLELGSQSSYAFVTRVTNALGHNAYSQFDYYLGKPVDAEDANGIVFSSYYDDPLDRPTILIRAANDPATKSRTSFNYDDAGHAHTTRSDLTSYNDPTPLNTQMVFDGLGRTTEIRQYETGTSYITTKRTYDALGRDYQVSNPYRAGENVRWRTTGYDALGRITSVTTADGAVIGTSYSGNQTTTTDQASRSRKSITDAAGRITTVYEDPFGVNYQTSYSYDVLDNLTQVTQDVQTRTFVYDSLQRIKSATNPEGGTTTYLYDNDDNMTQTTDPRGVVTTVDYDGLNRPISKSYSDGTPAVNYFYDDQVLPAGFPAFDRGHSITRLVAITWGGGSAGTYFGMDALGRVLRRIQRTDGINYLVEAAYNRAGSVVSETFPAAPGYVDRRTVSYSFDGSGRVSSLTSGATSYAAGVSASNIQYSPHGGLASETYGNTLVHTVAYNSRLQHSEIKLGTSGSPAAALGLTYNYGTTDNNGNVQSLSYSGGRSLTRRPSLTTR